MSKKNLLLAMTAMLLCTSFFTSPNVFAADEDEQQLLSQQRAETKRKSKPGIAQRQAIREALKALRKNGALERAKRQRSARRANQARNRVTANAATLSNSADSATEATDNFIDIKHVLLCQTEVNCNTAHDWAVTADYKSSGALTSNGHGGETMYHLFLRQEVLADEDVITSESSKLHESVKTLEGIRYATWMLDLDPAGEEDNGGNQ